MVTIFLACLATAVSGLSATPSGNLAFCISNQSGDTAWLYIPSSVCRSVKKSSGKSSYGITDNGSTKRLLQFANHLESHGLLELRAGTCLLNQKETLDVMMLYGTCIVTTSEEWLSRSITKVFEDELGHDIDTVYFYDSELQLVASTANSTFNTTHAAVIDLFSISLAIFIVYIYS